MNALVPLLLFAPVLVYVAVSDLRRMRIPNVASLIGLALFVVTLPLIGIDEALMRALTAAIVFGIGFVLFVLRIVAGGDVKILAVLMLFVPVQTLSLFGLVFSAAMLFSIALVLGMRALPVSRSSHWVAMRAHRHMPMGVSICFAGIGHLSLLSLWT